MDHSDTQVQNAIEIAWNPSSEQHLKAQAFEFLNLLRSNPAAAHICLSLFSRDPALDDIVRHFSLEVVNNAVQTGQLDHGSLLQIKDGLAGYIRRRYGTDASRDLADSPTIQNKLAQTLTYLFEALYLSGWESFFQDLLALDSTARESQGNLSVGTLFYLRVLASVHDEIADQLVNTSAEKQRQFAELKDLVRARDAIRISSSWQNILACWRNSAGVVTELCLKTIGRWVSWTDISLVVNEAIVSYLFQIAGSNVTGQSQQSKNRDAAIEVFTEIVGKKMKPNEKVELIRFLDLNNVVTQLISSPALAESRGSPTYDTDMAETVAKLVDNVVLDLVKILDSGDADDATRQQAEQTLQAFVPHLLRFFADEYDEVCSTVIPALTELLTLFRKFSKSKGSVPEPYHAMVKPILDAIVSKMRYDDTSSWGEEGEETDEAEFQELRKRLRVQQQIVASVDEPLYIKTVSDMVTSVLYRVRDAPGKINWRDVDLAMLELFILGEQAVKNGGLYQKRVPSSAASECLVQMMTLMVEFDVASFPHPAIHLQYMETCVRYSSFFEHHPHYIPKALERFIRFVHSEHVKVRARSYHLFLRFVRTLRLHLRNLSETAIRAIEDLLVVKAEVIEDTSADEMSSNENSQSADSLFSSQLYLFEAVGCMTAAGSISEDTQVTLASAVIRPLMSDLQSNVNVALAGDERAILQIHHLMMALGTLARGFCDWTPGGSEVHVREAVSLEFSNASDTILTALQSLKNSMNIRTAARFAFSRLIGVLGVKVLQQMPQWINGFLADDSTRDEMATFLRLIDQVIFGFKTQIYNILDELFTPLLRRIYSGLSEPTHGTDDEVQLGELRREYLSFLLNILGNGLESILVSNLNQAFFETVISTIEHFAKDTSDHTDSKMAMSVFTKMASVWGGADIPNPSTNTASPATTLPGFDRFMITRLSSITWSLMTSPDFNPKEPQSNRIIGEIAVLQQTILAKTGQEYISYLRDVELKNLGAQSAAIDEYLKALTNTDSKGFKTFLVKFLQRGR